MKNPDNQIQISERLDTFHNNSPEDGKPPEIIPNAAELSQSIKSKKSAIL